MGHLRPFAGVDRNAPGFADWPCAICGRPVEEREYRGLRKFCSDACRREDHRRRYFMYARRKAKAEAKPRWCVLCGDPISRWDSACRLTCSVSCARERKRRASFLRSIP